MFSLAGMGATHVRLDAENDRHRGDFPIGDILQSAWGGTGRFTFDP